VNVIGKIKNECSQLWDVPDGADVSIEKSVLLKNEIDKIPKGLGE
jgi:hypothetical protein